MTTHVIQLDAGQATKFGKDQEYTEQLFKRARELADRCKQRVEIWNSAGVCVGYTHPRNEAIVFHLEYEAVEVTRQRLEAWVKHGYAIAAAPAVPERS